MADGMREKTTNVGGVIKRIWYAMTGTTQGAELASLDDTGKFKCVNQQISGLAGTGKRMVVADSTGSLSASRVEIRRIDLVDFSSTTFIEVATIGFLVADITVGFYNKNSGGQGYVKIICSQYANTHLAFSDMTGCGVSFQVTGNILQAKVTSGVIGLFIKIEGLV